MQGKGAREMPALLSARKTNIHLPESKRATKETVEKWVQLPPPSSGLPLYLCSLVIARNYEVYRDSRSMRRTTQTFSKLHDGCDILIFRFCA